MGSAAVIDLENVTKVYRHPFRARRDVVALRAVSLEIHPGEVFGLVGPNRAGKTTLLKILLSLCRATAGRVRRFGIPASERSTLSRIGYVHEHPAFPLYLTARGLLEYCGTLGLLTAARTHRKIPALLERLGLADRQQEPIARFSKGMVQRLALAQALMNDPDLLVLDEPTEGLDAAGRQLFQAVIGDQQRQGRTTLLVSHNHGDVKQLCDRVALLIEGQVTSLGPPREVLVDAAPAESDHSRVWPDRLHEELVR